MTNQAKQQLTVWWVLWATFQTGIFVFYHFLGSTGAGPQPPTAESPVWLAAIAPVALSAIVRWLVLLRAQSAQTALLLFILGIAMAEATCFLGLLIFPAHKQELLMLSALGIFQFIPFFARRFFEHADPDRNA
jgi:hypothetical protein